ncbi:MAG: hypothetical protein LBT58_03380, partial [Endomicrobium sp.]|nr:hypothetical protein [Endomicrobium sp.]
MQGKTNTDELSEDDIKVVGKAELLLQRKGKFGLELRALSAYSAAYTRYIGIRMRSKLGWAWGRMDIGYSSDTRRIALYNHYGKRANAKSGSEVQNLIFS